MSATAGKRTKKSGSVNRRAKSKANGHTKPKKVKVPSRSEQDAGLRIEVKKLIESGNVDGALNAVFSMVGSLRDDNERLGTRVAHLTRLIYGRRSERLSKVELHQLMLAFGATEEEASKDPPDVPQPRSNESLCDDEGSRNDESTEQEKKKPQKKKRNHPGRTRLSDKLKRHVTDTSVPDGERACCQCGAEMGLIGHQEHERVEYVPAQIIVHVERREKLGCKRCRGDAVTAERQEAPAIVGRADVSVIAHLIESKCEDALPIHRQANQLRRLGWDVPTNTLYGYWKHGTELLAPVAHVVQSMVLGGHVVGIDDTKVDFLDETNHGKRRRGHLWAFANAGGMIAYSFTRTWEAEEVAPWIQAAEGFIQIDDYKGYSKPFRGADGKLSPLVPPERRLGCGMHIRRRFEKALRAGDKRAVIPMEIFREIYRVEREAHEFSANERLFLRRKKSIPLLDRLDKWIVEHKNQLRPSELLAEARNYAEQQQPFFERCFSDGRFAIDNGDVERGMRRIAMGRRNWLFSGASTGAPRLAVAYTLIESCRRLGLPSNEYLRDVLCKIDQGWPMRRVTELTPDAWGRERGLILAA